MNNLANPIVWVVIFFFGVSIVLVDLLDGITLGWLLDPSYRKKGRVMKHKLALIIITLSVMLAVFNFSTIPFAGGDNFAYYHLSRAIAQGKGYIELWDANLPLHTQYPPMFPILLLPASLFNSYIGAKVIVFLCYILMLWFAWKFYRKIEDRETALLALGILAFSPVVIEYSSLVLSEIPFMMFSIIALYLYSKKKYGQALLFATLTFLTRAIGVTLLVAMSWCYWREE